MKDNRKKKIMYEMGEFLGNHRINVLHETNLLSFSYDCSYDNSKLAKIEKGEIDVKFTTFVTILKEYRVPMKERIALLEKLLLLE